MSKEAFEPDEFDEIAEDFPAGAHRRPVKSWHSWLPVLIILVLGPTLAWGCFMLVDKMNNPANTTAAEAKVGSTAKKEAAPKEDKPAASDSAAPSSENKPSGDSANGSNPAGSDTLSNPSAGNDAPQMAAPNGNADKSLAVRVLNTTKQKGAAKGLADKLQAAGFNRVEAANGSGKGVDSAQVLYQNDRDRATAEEVAKILGYGPPQKAKANMKMTAPILVFIR